MNSKQRTAIGLLLLAASIRPLATAIGPVLPELQHDIQMGSFQTGMIGMVPVLCSGLFAPLGVRLGQNCGSRCALLIALGFIVLFGAARSVAPDFTAMLMLSIGMGIGMGIAVGVPPILVRRRSEENPSSLMAMFATGIVTGAALTAWTMVPLSLAFGTWRAAMAIIAGGALLAGILGLWLVGPDPRRGPRIDLWHIGSSDPVSWLLALIFGLQSVIAWGLMTWLPELLMQSGWKPAEAGSVTAILLGVGIPTGLIVSGLGSRTSSRRLLVVATATATAGIAAIGLLPSAAFISVVFTGFGLGAAFPPVLALPVELGVSEEDVGTKSSVMLLFGYVIAAIGPLGLGLVRTFTADIGAVVSMLVVCGLLGVGLVARVLPNKPGSIEVRSTRSS